jgi:hypothetical protein
MNIFVTSPRTLALCLALLGACGSNTLPSGSDKTPAPPYTPTSSNPDLALASPADLAQASSSTGSTTPIMCGAMTCAVGQVCCFARVGMTMMAAAACQAPGTCGDGGVQATCDGPSACGGATPNCCLEVSLSKNMSIMGDAMCTADCAATASNAGGNVSLTTKLCKSDGDCAGYMGMALGLMLGFNNCCSKAGIPAHFCAPPAALAMGMYTCP